MNRLWPVMTVVAILLFVGGTVSFVIMAFSHRVDLVTKDYYEKDLAYNDRQKKETLALALKDQISFSASRGITRIILPSETRSSECGGTIMFYNPLNPALDKSLKVQGKCGKEIQLQTPFLTKGRWKLQVDWASGTARYFRELTLNYEG